MNLSAVRPPIAFAAKNARFVSNFPQGSDELWMADLKACRHDVQCEVFEDILFVESNGTAFVYGIVISIFLFFNSIHFSLRHNNMVSTNSKFIIITIFIRKRLLIL